MHLIAPLIAGIAGAEDGTVVIRRRGTSALATVYSDFGGTILAQPSTGITLDSNGGLVAYVNELVDVDARDSNGTSVRSFVAGDAAPGVEVRSLSFTGTDYDSGVSAPGNPTTLQSVLDAWKTSAGEPDFDVLFNGASSTIQNALGSIAGIFRSVKSPAYGAVGDGTTDDTTAIQNAINAGNGIVWFPAGTYKQTAKLTVPTGVSLWGPAGATTALLLYHATADQLEYGTGTNTDLYQEIRGLTVRAGQSNSGKTISITNAGNRYLSVSNSFIGGSLNTGNVFNIAAPASSSHKLLLDACSINVYGSAAFGVTAASNSVYVEARNSTFTAGLDQWGGTFISSRNVVSVANTFDASVIATGTTAYVCIDAFGTAGYGPKALITGNRFLAGAAGTGYAMYSSYCDESTTSYVESANAIVGTFSGAVYGSLLVSSANRPRIVLGTRDTLIYSVSSDSATVPTKAHLYGMTVLTRAAAGGAQSLTATVGPEGAWWTVAVYNSTGAPLGGAVSFGTGFVSGVPTVNPAAGKISFYTFRVMVIGGSGAWCPVASSVTNT